MKCDNKLNNILWRDICSSKFYSYVTGQNENTWNLVALVCLVKVLLWVSSVTRKGLTSPIIPIMSRLAPPTSHTLLWIGQDLSGNTCRADSLKSCDASSQSHSLTQLPVWWWQLPTHLFTVGSHFLYLFPWAVHSALLTSEYAFYWLKISAQMSDP